MSNLKSYHACFVPLCTNTTRTTPQKMFLTVPQDVRRRFKWFQAVRRHNPKTSATLFCCEDHFDLPRDMDNYMEYKIMGSVKRVHMKPDCVPTRFNFHCDEQKCEICMPSTSCTDAKKRISVKRKNQDSKKSLCQAECKLKENTNAVDTINLRSDLEEDMDLCIIKKEEEIINEEIQNLYKDHIVEKDLVTHSEMVYDEAGINQILYKYIETINGAKQVFDKDNIKEEVAFESEVTKGYDVNLILKKEIELVDENTEVCDESLDRNVKKEPCDLKDVNLFIKHNNKIALEVNEENIKYLENVEIINVKTENLYEDHTIQNELVVGPEIIQEVNSSNYNKLVDGNTEVCDESIDCNVKEEPCDLKNVNLFIKNENEIALEVREEKMKNLESVKIKNVKTENLYEDHVIKDELVVGPEIIQEINSSNYNPINMNSSSIVEKNFKINKQYICDYCRKSFYSRCDIQRHLLQHDTKKLNCHLCSKTFTYQTNLWRHLRTHWGIKPHQCSQCGKTFARKDYLKFHMQTKHLNIKLSEIKTVRAPSTCNLCYKEFTSKYSCNHHKKYSCPMNKNKQKLKKNKLYICDVCNKSYIYRSSLSAHIVRHDTNKHGILSPIHQCDFCGKKYMKKHNLQCHMQSKHLHVSPYKCKKCKETFTWHSTLAAHEKKMHGRV